VSAAQGQAQSRKVKAGIDSGRRASAPSPRVAIAGPSAGPPKG
jgi:hypothetical protein